MKQKTAKTHYRFYRLIYMALVGILTAVLPGCGGGGGGSGQSNPTVGVIAVDPADGDTSIERNAVVTATFTDGMDEATINDANFILGDSIGNSISGVVSFDATGKVATFTPSTELGIFRTYTATLSTNITHSGGVPITETNWSFVTRDGVWSAAEKIETDSATGTNPHVAFDPEGNAIAVWINNTTDVVANIYTASTNSWGNTTLVEKWNSGVSDLQVAMDNNGAAIAVWTKTQGSVKNIQAARYNGTSWTAGVSLESNSGIAQSPQVAIDGAGNAIVVWLQPSTGFNSVWYNRYDAGGDVWGTAALLETADTAANAPQISIEDGGDAIATWAQDNGSGNNAIYAAYYSAGSGWGTADPIGAGTSNGFTAQIAMDGNGNAIAVWYQVTATSPLFVYSIRSNRYSGGLWDTDVEIENSVNTAATPQIAFDAQGNGMAVWKNSNGRLRYNTYSSITGWGTVDNVESGSNPAFIPQLAVDAEGNAIVVWRQYSDGTYVYSMWSNRYQTGNGWGVPELLEMDDTNVVLYPDVAIDTNGNSFAIWIQNDGTSDSTWVSRFD